MEHGVNNIDQIKIDVEELSTPVSSTPIFNNMYGIFRTQVGMVTILKEICVYRYKVTHVINYLLNKLFIK